MKQTDLAWAAGFIDGEGSFVAVKPRLVPSKHGMRIKRYPYVVLSVDQVDVRVLKKLQKILGGTISGPYTYRGNRPKHQFHLYKNTESAYRELYPYLGAVKRKQGAIALKTTKQQNRLLRGI